MTESELSTFNFFESIEIDLFPVPPTQDPEPDFEARIGSQTVFIEVKEIQDNDDERAVIERIESSDQCDAYGSTDSANRIREKLRQANSQLRIRCSESHSGVMVLQDVRSFWTRDIYIHESIKQAMFGNREVWRARPSQRNGYTSRIVSDRFTRDRSLTAKKNRSISALALIVTGQTMDESKMFLFHNRFAKVPFNAARLRCPRFKEYAIQSTDSYGQFEELT